MAKVGRPPVFKNAKELQNKIQEYITSCPDKKEVVTKDGETINLPTPTISGLCYFLGFESRQSFYDYGDKPEFSYTIKRAKLFIENVYEKQLQYSNCTGAIFALKNFGWKDKQLELNVNGDGINIVVANEEDKELLEGI